MQMHIYNRYFAAVVFTASKHAVIQRYDGEHTTLIAQKK